MFISLLSFFFKCAKPFRDFHRMQLLAPASKSTVESYNLLHNLRYEILQRELPLAQFGRPVDVRHSNAFFSIKINKNMFLLGYTNNKRILVGNKIRFDQAKKIVGFIIKVIGMFFINPMEMSPNLVLSFVGHVSDVTFSFFFPGQVHNKRSQRL